MAFFTWLSRARSSCKPSKFFQNFFVQSNHTARFQFQSQSRILENTIIVNSSNSNKQSWRTYLLPIVLAISGGSLALQLQKNPSLCDSPNLQERYFRFSSSSFRWFLTWGLVVLVLLKWIFWTFQFQKWAYWGQR